MNSLDWIFFFFFGGGGGWDKTFEISIQSFQLGAFNSRGEL